MNAYVERVIEYVKKKHGDEPEFVQTVEEEEARGRAGVRADGGGSVQLHLARD